MSYITTTQLSQRLGSGLYARLTDRETGTTADETTAQQVIDEAEAEANAYLARRYATPLDLTAHPELAAVLAARVLDLAEYGAWKGSPFVSDLPERVDQVYAAARQWFETVASGRSDLPAAGPPASRVAADDGPRRQSTARQFTHDELDGL